MSDPEQPESMASAQNSPEDNTDPIIGKAVGTRLKSLFTEFASEDVPDRFMDLIGQLEEKEQADKTGDSPTSGSQT